MERATPHLEAPCRLSVEEVVRALATDAAQGLTALEADARLRRHGPNALSSRPPVPAWRRFLGQFTHLLVMLLIVAAAMSGLLWMFERATALPYEAITISAIVLINACMGYIQQARAEKAVAALRQMSSAQARVIRDGGVRTIAAAALVPGDVILVEEGDTIPADGRLIACAALQTAEAALTGESLPVAKQTAAIDHEAGPADQTCMVFSGTTATYGHGKAVVTATGMQTRIGQIAGLLEQAPPESTPLQRELDRVGRLLATIVALLAAVVIAAILLVQEVKGLPALFDVLILGVALAVAAVPEGLPAIVTAVLALGTQRMARRNAIVRRLGAVETLGSANVIVADKTGTLTRNEMTVRRILTASGGVVLGGTGYAPEGTVRRADGGEVAGPLRQELVHALSAADRANNAVLRKDGGRWTVEGDPTEGALIVAARKAGLEREALDARFGRIAEVPFSSERKLMSTVHTDTRREAHLLAFTKGAPDVLLARCSGEMTGDTVRPLTEQRRAEIRAANEALAGQALRTLAVAARLLPRASFAHAAGSGAADSGIEQDLVFLGLIGMLDPPRSGARKAIAAARAAGIRSIMMTGDHPRTAAVIAREVGLANERPPLTGPQLEAMDDAALDAAARTVPVFARTEPKHKLRLVQSLQRQGMTVAMTGDGVNDAPALRTADIGIAMGRTGTDVAREAADMVLADDDFATIVSAVEEGRAIFDNIRKFLRYLLSSNFGEVMTMVFGILLADVIGLENTQGGLALPLLATHILWINLITDGAPALALGLDPADPGLMARPPRPRTEGVISARMWRGIAFVGMVMAAGTLLMFDAALPGGLIAGQGTFVHAQTMAFTTLTLFQLFNLLNARSDRRSAFHGMLENPWLWGAAGLSLMLQVAVVHLPQLQAAFSTVDLSLGDWLLCTLAASSVLWLRELCKLAERFAEARRA